MKRRRTSAKNRKRENKDRFLYDEFVDNLFHGRPAKYHWVDDSNKHHMAVAIGTTGIPSNYWCINCNRRVMEHETINEEYHDYCQGLLEYKPLNPEKYKSKESNDELSEM